MKKDIRIVVLQSGWVVVGLYHISETTCKLTSAYVIRQWGTTAGLGEIAMNGPTKNTVLDRAGIVKYQQSSYILDIECDPKKWDSFI